MPTVRVRLVDVPVALYCATDQHASDLLREVALVAAARPDLGKGHLFTELLDAAEQEVLRPAARRRLQETVEAALHAGLPTITVELDADIRTADRALAWESMLQRFDTMSQEERLLTLPAEPMVRAYRAWYVTEVVEQIRTRRDPVPWTAAGSLAVAG